MQSTMDRLNSAAHGDARLPSVSEHNALRASHAALLEKHERVTARYAALDTIAFDYNTLKRRSIIE